MLIAEDLEDYLCFKFFFEDLKHRFLAALLIFQFTSAMTRMHEAILSTCCFLIASTLMTLFLNSLTLLTVLI